MEREGEGSYTFSFSGRNGLSWPHVSMPLFAHWESGSPPTPHFVCGCVSPSENCCTSWLDTHSSLQGDKDPVWRLGFKSAPWLSADALVVEPQATDKERRKAFFSLQPQPVSFPPMACLLCWLGQDKTLLGYINAATVPRGGELTSVKRSITSPQVTAGRGENNTGGVEARQGQRYQWNECV